MDGSRRAALRTIAVGAASGLGATGGCLETVFGARESRVVDETRTLTVEDALSPAATTDRMAATVAEYGPHGFWGTAEATPDHEMELIGGWGDDATVADDALETARLLACYELPGRSAEGERRYLLWFWIAARPTETGEAPTVSRLATGVTLATESFSMGQYAPTGAGGDGDIVSVGLGIFDVRTPAVEFPADPAAIDLVPERTRVGDGGGFHPVWTGETADAQSLLGACEVAGPGPDALELEWRAVVAVRD